MIRISVTDLETYRYWKADEEATLLDLVADLTFVEETPQMIASRAFHKALEVAPEGEYAMMETDGYKFRFELSTPATLATSQLREMKAEQRRITSSGPVTLVGKVDGLLGLTVRDWKLSERFDADRYLDSWQWRAYLDIFNAHTFVYDVFQCVYDRYDPMLVHITEHHQLRLHRYPNLSADLAAVVDELAAIIAKHVPAKVAA